MGQRSKSYPLYLTDERGEEISDREAARRAVVGFQRGLEELTGGWYSPVSCAGEEKEEV